MSVYDIVVIGAGPAGISIAVEARAAGIPSEKIIVLEKAEEHSFTLKKVYPEGKLVTANYKGFEAVCTGVMCMPDLSKSETISFLDRSLGDHGIPVRYREQVYKIFKHEERQLFTVYADRDTYEATVVAIAIGILGKPNKPEYAIPRGLRGRLLFDVATVPLRNIDILVVGGGDSASEYCQYLVQQENRVTLSYRRRDFSRMNDINRESLLALAERHRLTVMYESTILKVTDSGGKPEVHFREPAFGVRIYDAVVSALKGPTPENFLKTIGIEFNGESSHLRDGYETSVPGMFLVGDLSAGPQGGSIIWTFNSATTAMKRIVREYLQKAGTS